MLILRTQRLVATTLVLFEYVLIPLFLLVQVAAPQYQDYVIPRPRIVAFTPSGLRIFIPHEEGIDLVGLIANINQPLEASASNGLIKREIRVPRNGRWIFNDPDRALQVGDVINYKLAVRRWGRTYFSGPHSFRIKALTPLNGQTDGIVWPGNLLSANPQEPPPVIQQTTTTTRRPVNPRPPPPAAGVRPPNQRPPVTPVVAQQGCQPSPTVVRGKPACKGQLIFEDHFDTLNTRTWQYNIRIADAPDYEFCIYDKRPENAYVEDGLLQIRPSLTDQVYGKPFIVNGTLDLEDCTATASEECHQEATFGFVMPAVISSRLRSAPNFSFKFGRVEVRAKMAAGDWLLSSILLQPLRNAYGPRYDSGQMRLAMSRGNRDLQCDDVGTGLSQVEAGIVLTSGEEAIRRDLGSRELTKGWDKDFHVYRLDWTAEKMTFMVDGKVVHTITPPDGGFGTHEEFEEAMNPWSSGTKLAPFDREFFIALNLGCGGIHDFPDNCVNNGQPKPWTNGQPKAKLNFYKKQNEWAPTWRSPLQIDYVKVWAL